MPAAMQRTIDHWRRVMPDHEVIEWNEKNYDIGAHPWTARMHAKGDYAFASDHARLRILHLHGGIYLDTDMQLKKSLTPFMGSRCLWSFEFDSFLSTALIAAEPAHPLIESLMLIYDDLEHGVVNNDLVTRYFLEHFPEFKLNNTEQMVGEGIRIMPKEYFVVPSFDPAHNYAVHLANNHWKKVGRSFPLGRLVRTVVGEVWFYRLVNMRMKVGSPYLALERRLRRERNSRS